jgi:hypothetical protein
MKNGWSPSDVTQAAAGGRLPRRFRLLHRNELDAVLRPAWAVKGLLPQTGLAVCYGPSGAGKTFLLLDLVCAIAEGAEWFGHRSAKAPVIYLCLEGAPGFVSRIRAWEAARKRGLPELVRCSVQEFDLHDEEAVEALVRSVLGLTCCLPAGLAPPIVVIDTLNRATVGADENSSVSMGESIGACTRISEGIGGLVVLGHHSGKDMERGMRGHNSLAAAADAVLLVRRSGQKRTWDAQKVKDGQDGVSGTFELESVVVGHDSDGEQVTSCVVNPVCSPEPLRPTVPRRLAMALAALKALLPPEASRDLELVIPEARWREAFLSACPATSGSGKRTAVARARADLFEAGLVIAHEDQFRLTPAGVSMLLLD